MTTILPTPYSTPEKPAIHTTQAHHDLLPLEFFTSRHRVCPYAQRVDILLQEHFGQDVEERFIKRVEIDLNEPRLEWYLRTVNPLGKVPAIRQHSHEVLWESMVILEYLCDRLDDEDARKVYWPHSAYWRAKARLFMKWFSDNFIKTFWKVLTTSNDDADTLEKAKRDLVDVMKEVRLFFYSQKCVE
jgi:glutathione S-transferase